MQFLNYAFLTGSIYMDLVRNGGEGGGQLFSESVSNLKILHIVNNEPNSRIVLSD